MKKSEIGQQLKDWAADIACDIKADWSEPAQKEEMRTQWGTIWQMIGLLESLGPNDNIKE